MQKGRKSMANFKKSIIEQAQSEASVYEKNKEQTQKQFNETEETKNTVTPSVPVEEVASQIATTNKTVEDEKTVNDETKIDESLQAIYSDFIAKSKKPEQKIQMNIRVKRSTRMWYETEAKKLGKPITTLMNYALVDYMERINAIKETQHSE